MALQPDSAEIHANLGTLAAHQQEWSVALQSFRRAIALKPELATALQPNLDQLWTQIDQSGALQAFLDQPDQLEAIDHQMLGDCLLKKEQVEAAVQCYENAIAIDPTLATAFWNLSLAHKQLGHSEAMLTTYFQALCLQPDWATAEEHCKLGNHFLQQEQWDQAIACYERSIAQDAALAEAHFGLGTALQKMERLEGAIEAYERAIELQPEAWLTHHNLGDIFLEQKQWFQAVEAYERSIALNPLYSWSHNNLGDALIELEQWQAATESYRKAILLKPDFYWSHYNLGDAFIALGQWDEAIKSYCCAIEINQNLLLAYQKLQDISRRNRCFDEVAAKGCYQQLPQRAPNNALAHIVLGGFQEKVEDQAGAIASYQRAIELQPEQPAWVYLSLTQMLIKSERWDEARLVCQNVVDSRPELWLVHQKFGDLLIEKQQWKEAASVFQKIIDYNPNFLSSYEKLSNVLVKLERWEEAINVLNLAAKLHENSSIHQRIGDLHKQASEVFIKKAFDSYWKSIQLDDKNIESYHSAIQVNPSSTNLYVGLADTLAKEKKLHEAIVFYKASFQFGDRAPETYFKLGRVLEEQENFVEALKCYREAYRLNSTETSYLSKVEETCKHLKMKI
ncbi:tetratricopeptide repeat protein [Microcoleus sp. FACHB-1515]|nr:tetratricopeptide repeat protein [Microcoleus sp. FACHB-1515]